MVCAVRYVFQELNTLTKDGTVKFNNLLMAVQQDLPITVRHEKWLSQHANVKYPDKHVQTIAKLLVAGDRDRLHAFSSSSTGTCLRRQIFSYFGKPARAVGSSTANIFHTGNFIHAKWQLAGLTEGWLKEIEVPVYSEQYNLKGTMDGILWDDSGFEFKSINSNGYRDVMAYGPKREHQAQVQAYMMITHIQRFSIVYENKNDGEWREFRVERDPDAIRQIQADLVELNAHVTHKSLPDPLTECKGKEGPYLRCPFRDICLKTRSIDG